MADDSKKRSAPDDGDDTIAEPVPSSDAAPDGGTTLPMHPVGRKKPDVAPGDKTLQEPRVVIAPEKTGDDVTDITMSEVEFVDDAARGSKPSAPPPPPKAGAAEPSTKRRPSTVPPPPKTEGQKTMPDASVMGQENQEKRDSKISVPPPRSSKPPASPKPSASPEPSSPPKPPTSSKPSASPKPSAPPPPPSAAKPAAEGVAISTPPVEVSSPAAARESSPGEEPAAPSNRRVMRFPTLPMSKEQLLEKIDEVATSKRAPARFPTLPPTARDELDQLSLEEEAKALVALIERELEGKPEPLRAARLHYELASTYEQLLDDRGRAANHYQQATKLWPEHKPSLRGARRVLLALGRPREALSLFDAEVRVTKDPKRRAMLLLQKGQILEDHLQKESEARDAYREALDLHGDAPSILKALWRADRRHEDWAALTVTTEGLSNTIADDAEQRAALVASRAYLAEARESEPAKAADLYEASLELDLRAPGALSALKRLCHQRGRWAELVGLFQHDLELSAEPEVRLNAYRSMARLYQERLGDLNKAILTLEAATNEMPRKVDLLEQLIDLYDLARRDEALARALERLFELVEEQGERLLLAHRVATVYETRLGYDEPSRRWFERALSIDPCFGPALDALGVLYERLGDWSSLIQMHQQQIESGCSEQERALAHARVAAVFEVKLGRLDEATFHYDRALGLVPGHESSLKALTRLHAQAGRWRELAELYQRVVDQSPGKDRKIAYLFRIGAIYEDRLDDPLGAVHAYRRILEMVSDHLGAIQAVERAAERAGEWSVLLEMLEREVKLTKGLETKVSLLCRAAEVSDTHLGDADAAIQRLDRVLGLDASNVVALDALARIYQRTGRWDDLLKTYQNKLHHAAAGAERARLIHKMAELCENQLGREREAVTFYRQALTTDPTHRPSFDALVRLLTHRESFSDLARLMEQQLERLDDPGEKGEMCLEIARIYEEKLKNSVDALANYERALDVVPTLMPAYDGRTRLLTAAGRWKPLAENLGAQAELSPDPTIALNAKVEEGLLYAHRLDDRARAVSCFEWVLERAPGHRGALLVLEELHLKAEEREALIEVVRKQAEALVDRSARVAALREVARLERLAGRDEAARHAYHQLLELVEDDEAALEGLVELAARRDESAEVVPLVNRLVHVSDDADLEGMRLGQVALALEQRGDLSVLTSFRAALVLDPDSHLATRGFTRAARRSGDPEALREAAQREAKVTRDVPLAVSLLKRSAAIRNERHDHEGMVVDLEQALELAPEDAETAKQLTEVLLWLDQVPRLVELLGRAADAVEAPKRKAELHLAAAEIYSQRLRNLPAAVAASQRALKASPDHLQVLARLADDLEANEQWQEAVETLRRIVDKTNDTDTLVRAHLRIAVISQDRLEQPERAVPSLRVVLQRQADNPAALYRMSTIEAERGRHEQALELARRLSEVAATDGERAVALIQMATIELSRERPKEATSALAEAVALEGAEGEAVRRYTALIEAKRPDAHWVDLLTALNSHIDRASELGRPTGPSHRLAASILADRLGRPDEAIETLRRRVITSPGDVDARLHLVQLLQDRGDWDGVIDEVRRLLAQDVTVADAWRMLGRAMAARGDEVEASAATQPLRLLDAAAAEEVVDVMARQPRCGETPPGFPAGPEFVDLQIPAEHDATAALIAGLASTFAKLYPVDPGRYGLSKRDRINTRSGSALRNQADEVAAALGVTGFDLYITGQGEPDVVIEPGKPPALFVPGWATALGEAEQVFLFARPLVHLARGAHVIHRVSAEELTLLLAAAARQVDLSFGADLARDAILEEKGRELAKAMPWRASKSLTPLIESYIESPSDVHAWYAAAHTTAARIALLLSDDVVAAVGIVERITGEPVDAGLAAELLRFWVSPTAAAYRRALVKTC